jgi:hypothetical protein
VRRLPGFEIGKTAFCNQKCLLQPPRDSKIAAPWGGRFDYRLPLLPVEKNRYGRL